MNRGGFTLIETVVAVAIAGLLLWLLAGQLGSTRQASTATERVSAAATMRLAMELMREELLRAGSAPWPAPAVDAPVMDLPSGQTAEQFVGQGLRLTPAPGGHSLRIVYIDDRLSGALVARDLTLEAGVDGQGQPQLFRRSGSSARQPWVAGLERLSVQSGVTEQGPSVGTAALVGQRVSALWLEFEVMGEVALALFELPHKPLVVAP